MILIDRQYLEQFIILTLDETPSYSKLLLQSDATRQHFEIELGANISPYIERYDKFNVATAAFDGMPDGYYSYKIKDAELDIVIESGKLYIEPAAPEPLNSVLDPQPINKIFTKI